MACPLEEAVANRGNEEASEPNDESTVEVKEPTEEIFRSFHDQADGNWGSE